MTAAEWIDARIDGGLRSSLGRHLALSQTTLNGIDVDALSAISVVHSFTGTFDERYVVAGGADRLVAGLAERIGDGAIADRVSLDALRRAGDDALLVLGDGTATREVRARRAILALPFARLRECDLDGAGLAPMTLRVIRELPMGTNAKLHLNAEPDPWWRRVGFNGDGQSDALQTVWDEMPGDPSGTGRLVQYTGGRLGATMLADVSALPHATVHLRATEAAQRAVADLFGRGRVPLQGGAHLDRWADDPWTRGSYSGYVAGQWTEIAGYAGGAEPPFHFAGEHTSVWQGSMNGAVESGERAAREILDG